MIICIFVLAVLSKRKIYLEFISKSNLPSKQTREKYLVLHLVYHLLGELVPFRLIIPIKRFLNGDDGTGLYNLPIELNDLIYLEHLRSVPGRVGVL